MLKSLDDRLDLVTDGNKLNRWLKAVTPYYNWDWLYLLYIQDRLNAITAGHLKKLMIFIPPRHGKSEMCTIRYPVYRLEQNPAMHVVIGAYNATLANKFSRRARKIGATRFALSEERKAVEDWETAQGGGLRAVGVGGGITGQGGDLIVIDDPIKNREEAESIAYRDRVWDWYSNDIYTRLEPGAAIILIMTRWHMDDLAGRILASDDARNWEIVTLPAEAEAGDLLGRAIGEPLNPDRYGLEALHSIKTVLGRDYVSLYQQRPQPREGGMFKYHWFKLVDAVPAGGVRVRWWDKGATEGGGDYTAGVLICYVNHQWFVEDVIRGQWSFGERDAIIRATAQRDKEKYGFVTYWGPQDPGQAGKVEAAAFMSLLAGYEVHTQPETGSKETRAAPLSSQCEAGNVFVLKADWTQGYLNEMCEFPSGAHDDQVDASSGAFSKLSGVVDLGAWADQYRQMTGDNPPIVSQPQLPYNVGVDVARPPLGDKPFTLSGS